MLCLPAVVIKIIIRIQNMQRGGASSSSKNGIGGTATVSLPTKRRNTNYRRRRATSRRRAVAREDAAITPPLRHLLLLRNGDTATHRCPRCRRRTRRRYHTFEGHSVRYVRGRTRTTRQTERSFNTRVWETRTNEDNKLLCERKEV